MTTKGKKPRKSRKTPVAGAPEAIEVAPTEATAVPEAIEPALASAVVAPVEVAQTVPVEIAKPIEVAQTVPVEIAKPIEAAKPIEVAKPIEAAKPIEVAKPIEAAKPIEVAKPIEAAKPIEVAKPVVAAPESTEPAPDYPLAVEAGPLPILVQPPILPSPAEAALEAARIVSEMVDIDSESGAVIAVAAAAGAAIEAAHAAQKAAPPALTDLHAAHDPVSTVRLSRDRILQALSDDSDGTTPAARLERARSEPRARTEPGVEEPEEFDPVAIAAAAIGRLRSRARTDLAELRAQYQRHDVLVVVLALVIIVVAGRIHARLVTPPDQIFTQRGLTFEHSAAWLKAEELPAPAPRLLHDAIGNAMPAKDDAILHVELTAPTGSAKIEVLVDKKPAWSNIVTGLELDRRTRWGELYRLDDSSVRAIAGHDWLRTAYSYAHVREKGDEPGVDHAIEYATIDRDQIYVITLFGTPAETAIVEDVVAPSLRVQSQTGLPLVPQTSRISQRTFPSPVGIAFGSTVMVVVADLVDGRLKARGGGSGVIVGGDGSILTNYHVIHDKDGRLHDVFVIARYSGLDLAPQLQCAGRPNRGKLARDRDLALIKCDMDLDGRSWSPTSSGVWATLPEARASEIKMGQRLWVLGYPDVGGGGLTLSEGEVEGWTGEDGATGKDFLKTDASITHGNSGGPVVDDRGRLVGIASAFRTKVTASGSVIETAQVGLVRPLQTASDLLAIAAAGWTPLEGHTDVDLTPTAVEAAAEGVRIYTTVVDDATEAPIRDATVMVMRSGVDRSAIDVNRLDDQVIAWGKTNAFGEVRLKQLVPVPGNYAVMVFAPGYEQLIGEGEIHLDAKTPPSFDPWGKIGLRAR